MLFLWVRYHLNSAAAGVPPTCASCMFFTSLEWRLSTFLHYLSFGLSWSSKAAWFRWEHTAFALRTTSFLPANFAHCIRRSWRSPSQADAINDAVSSDWAKPLDIPGISWLAVCLVASDACCTPDYTWDILAHRLATSLMGLLAKSEECQGCQGTLVALKSVNNGPAKQMMWFSAGD